MTNTWFRFHRSAVNNPKVQRLSGDDFKGWINVLCVANEDGSLPPIEDVSFVLRETKERVSSLFHTLVENTLLVTDGETFHVYNWKKRQYKSDTSTERVKRFRERQRNVTETPQKQNRTDSETEQKEPPVIPLKGEPQKPGKTVSKRKKKTPLPEHFPFAENLDAALTYWDSINRNDLLPDEEALKFTDHCKANGKTYLDWGAAWRTWFRNAAKFNRGPPTNGADTRADWMIEQDEKQASIDRAVQKMREDAENGQPN